MLHDHSSVLTTDNTGVSEGTDWDLALENMLVTYIFLNRSNTIL